MKINISYILEEHGWSTCWVNENGKPIEITITHVWIEDPIEICLEALIGIMKGETHRQFDWYGEPGGNRVIIDEIPTKKHMVNFKVVGFSACFGETIDETEIRDNIPEVHFEIKKIQLIRMLYFEFKKISELMKDKHYELNRKNEFPFSKFRTFEILAIDYTKQAD